MHDLNAADDSLEREGGILCDEIVVKIKEASSQFWRNLRIKENMILQKSRVRWMKEGDSNSKYFHSMMKERRRVNHLGFIVAEMGMLESVEEVRKEVFNHFRFKFVEMEEDRPLLEGVAFNSLREEHGRELEKPFLENKLKKQFGVVGRQKSGSGWV